MIATVSNCLDDARAILGDDAGRLYTNAILLPHFNRANRTLIRAISALGSLTFQREAYPILPANQSYLLPASFGVADFKEPRLLEQRGSLTTYAVSGAANIATGVRVTTATHTLNTGDVVTCQGITTMTGTDGIWGISVPDDTHVDLLGAVGVGSYVSGGVICFSLSGWYEMDKLEVLPQYTPDGQQLVNYAWFDNALHFIPSTTDTQLRIVFWASGPDISSTTQSTVADDIRDILATLTAGYGAQSRGATDKASMALSQALGPDQDPDVPGGLLLQTIRLAIRQMQAVPSEERRRPPFREQMSPWPLIW